MMMEGFLRLEVGGALSVAAFLFLVSRSVNVEPFLVRGLPSGTVYTLGFAASAGAAEGFLFLASRSTNMEPFLFCPGSSGKVVGFLSFLFLSTL